MAGAALWIIIYIVASEDAGVKEQLAIMIAAVLMWILFLWAFLLFRKLSKLTQEVRRIEKKLVDVMVSDDGGSES